MYSESHHKITIYGDAYGGSEAWSFGFKMRSPNAVSPTTAAQDEATQTFASLLQTPVQNFWNRPAGVGAFMETHRLQGIKVALIMPNGLYPEGHVPGEVYFANVPGPTAAAGNVYVLPQSAVACTLVTAKPRGLASKGRFFLPPTYSAISAADGLMPVATRDAIQTAVRDFLTAVNNADPSALDIAIFSKGPGQKSFNAETGKVEWSYPTIGSYNVVTGVEVGRVIDTQRRRRRSLVESRGHANLG